MPKDEATAKLTRQLIDQGLLMDAGWQIYRVLSRADTLSTIHQVALKEAFFAGAQHLFGSIISMLDPGNAVTQKELQHLSAIAQEMETFAAHLKLKYGRSMGQG